MTTKSPTKTRRSQAERMAQTRNELLDAGMRLLERDGYRACTFKGIAEESGLTTGAVQHHFRTRSDILIALIMDRVFLVDTKDLHAIDPNWDLATTSRQIIENVWQYYSRPSQLVFWELIFGVWREPEIWKAISAWQYEFLRERISIFHSVFKRFGITLEQSEVLLHFVAVKLSGLGIMKMQYPDADSDTQVELLVDATLNLLERFVAESGN